MVYVGIFYGNSGGTPEFYSVRRNIRAACVMDGASVDNQVAARISKDQCFIGSH